MSNKNRTRVLKGISISILSLFIIVVPVSAHVVVKPNQAGVGAYQTFTVSVPVEKDSPTVGLRLLIPEGLQDVTPNVKPGWTITVKKTEIDWSGGSIPAGQRDEFMFSAQVPAKETTLQWKAYQTYQDGSVISWDQKQMEGEKDDDNATVGPYSETRIINDLKSTPQPMSKGNESSTTTLISLIALLFSVTAIGIQLRNRK